ncbi:pyruvate dehydrogenase E2 component (dihydrolipoamide acetyltransferase) [Tenacibaculum sp. MAR_2009_124]|uniref:pyruvate dehydrogenase complex dihydrolipoamide acetyltransferase n=1 Tax=Tenacibaculum sp. MAR_2009_124 TaxID=1250059 RepID=UPI000896274D|nr:pyruvate dehydrogenase complex dihydrolipoamide acetyltransferase [Tenacibaculum sp. MAR_2009_124]SEB35889.1 pyruvate dehydrogenase E2 component (dihydrolipoamide acetyltransferase) [Tenacibaculum sp. MAR_2009_124]
MATIINMPRLSDTMEEGVVAQWLKNVGDKVEEGDILAEIETDKATMEFESFHEGTLLHIGVNEGETAPVDTLLAIIGDEGEDFSSLVSGGQTTTNETQPEEAPKQDETTSDASSTTAIPEGVQVVTMPRLSDTMTEGTVASWLKNVGDKVEEGDILAEIETDKATMEFESFYEGTLLHIGINEGDSAPVDSLLAIIGAEGTDVATLVAAHKDGNLSTTTETSEKEAPKTDNTPAAQETPTVEAAANSSSNGRVFASPLAKKIAKDKGFNLSDIKGSGENGRIIKKDVENYTPAAKAATPQQSVPSASASVTSFAIAGQEGTEEVKNSQMRKAIAKSLSTSKFNAPHFYLNIEIDMDNAIQSRKIINQMPDTKVSFNDMVVKACAMALRRHPQVNTSWSDNATIYNKHIHVGVAVAVPDGLLVPVLKHADHMNINDIDIQVRDLAGRARNKKLSLDEMQGSTFTVSNLGMFGIESFTSIINQPNSAILSVGAIVEKPVVKNGQIVVGNTMKLTLACDHRTVDGAVGAQFLQTLKTYLENPVTMLA